MRRIFVTGTAGFIGYHFATLLLDEGFEVHGYDGFTGYYDVQLKRHRHKGLLQQQNFSATEAVVEDEAALQAAASNFGPDAIVHLAAQAGIRHSLEDPRAYLNSNVVGTFNVLQLARNIQVKHLLIASTSSVYGANESMPFREVENTDTPLSMYAATKKATEVVAHSHSHLSGIPTTVMRFFSVYGPWGRPDQALFKFVDAILDDRPIDLYNNGNIARDFTFVTDLVRAMRLLLPITPSHRDSRCDVRDDDSLSPVAPFRIVNIGNSQPVKLLDFVEIIEEQLGRRALRNYLPTQAGFVAKTWADTALLRALTGYQPRTNIRDGVEAFVNWFRDFYSK